MAQWGLLAALGLPSARQAQSLSQGSSPSLWGTSAPQPPGGAPAPTGGVRDVTYEYYLANPSAYPKGIADILIAGYQNELASQAAAQRQFGGVQNVPAGYVYDPDLGRYVTVTEYVASQTGIWAPVTGEGHTELPAGGVPRSVADYSMRLAEQYGPGSPQQAAYIHAYHLYGGNEEYARRAAANPDAYFAMFPGSGVGSAGGSSGVPGRAGSVGAAAPAPPQGQVDIFNPGPYLAQQLLSQRPGYVFGTRVPRPGQITLADWQQMLPAQRSALLGFYSALGIPPEDAVAEMIRFWLTPQPISSVRYLY